MNKKKHAFLKKLGARIIHLRETQQISQTKLAEICEKDKQSINRLEKGNVNPSVFYLLQVAEALNTSLSELLKLGE